MSVCSREAKDILTKHNDNEELNSPSALSGLMRRFVKFNGAVSAEQLHWLDDVLQKSDENDEVVLVASLSLLHCINLQCASANIKYMLSVKVIII